MPNRNILILFLSQSLGFASISFLILVASIMAADLSPTEPLVTLPLTLAIVGTAIATIPAAMLMKRIGRKNGFLLAYGLGLFGCLLGYWAARQQEFYLLCASALLIGGFLAFAHQFRFAAIESADSPERGTQAVSILLLGGVVAAFLGPQIAEWGKDLYPQPFAGSFLLLMGVLALSALVFAGFRNPPVPPETAAAAPARPLREIARQPVFLIALFSGAVSYGVMSFIMTATPISMHVIDHFDFTAARQVIQWHIAAMFLPSLFNVFLFRHVGVKLLMIAGSALYLLMGFIALQGHGLMHYGVSLILLGVGWNFLFVAGTALLPQSYRAAERFKTQACNDFIIFVIQGGVSLSAGWLLYTIGWDAMIAITLPLSALMLTVAILYGRNRINTAPKHREAAESER